MNPVHWEGENADLGDSAFQGMKKTASLTDAVETLEREMIQQAMATTGGNQRKASRSLGITERMFGYKLKIYGLKATAK